MTRQWQTFAFSILCYSLSGGSIAAQELPFITMKYYERKPFHYTLENGKVIGLVATPTERAFAKIGIPVQWELTPANRILNDIRRGDAAICSPGWYKTAAREEYARYTRPIYRDRPLVGLARSDFSVEQGITARELFARPEINLLVKENFSQGAYLDAIISKMLPEQIQSVSVEVSSMVKMIDLKRADLMVTTQEEVPIYVERAGLKLTNFRVLVFPDVPAVEMRYILCSKLVPASVMKKLNQAIRVIF